MHDSLQKFLLKSLDVRGAMVFLDGSWQEVLNRRPYPPQLTEWLGQATAATLLMASNIKFDGRLTFQLQSQGDLKLLVVQSDNHLAFRALAQTAESEKISSSDLLSVTQNGLIAISIENHHEKEPYQGLVGVQSETISENLELYFNQSEQLKTMLVLKANDQQAAGVLLQAMPSSHVTEEDWTRLRYLLDTFSLNELAKTDIETKIARLFAEDDVVVYPPLKPSFSCACSEEKTLMMLSGLPESDLSDIIDKNVPVRIACDFCGLTYQHDVATIAALFANRQHPN